MQIFGPRGDLYPADSQERVSQLCAAVPFVASSGTPVPPLTMTLQLVADE